MTQSLVVDTVRLEQAGTTLRGLALPDPPAPIVATGTDSVSAAINETMPVVESPVTDGLPAAEAALAKTASNLAAAAGRYADTDHSLGRHLAQQEFVPSRGVAENRPVATAADRQPSDARAELHDAPVAEKPPSPAVPSDVLQKVPSDAAGMGQQLNQFMGTAGSFTQSIFQSAQGAAQNQPLADQVLEEAERTDTDGEDQDAEEHLDGAAPGGHAYANSPAAPVAATSADRAPLTSKAADR